MLEKNDTKKGGPQKLVVLGLDAAIPDLVKQFMAEGALPNLKRLYDSGVYARHITTFPTLTAPAWGALSTGSGIGTAGIPSLTVKRVGEPLDTARSCFDSRFLEAETIWQSAARVGKKTVLMNWPVTWPPVPLNGVQIAGSINPPFRFYYMPIHDLAPSSVFTTELLPCDQTLGRAIRVCLGEGEERSFSIAVPPTLEDKKRYLVTLKRTQAQGYDAVEIRPEQAESATVPIVLRRGQQSGWIKASFSIAGKIRNGQFRFALTDLASDGSSIKLYVSVVATDEPITIPPEHAAALIEASGPYWEVDDPWAYLDGWISRDQYMNQLKEQTEWWGRATVHAIENYEFDLLFSWLGSIDHVQHVFWGGIDEHYQWFDPAQKDMYMSLIRQVYQQVDYWVGQIVSVLPPETLVVAVSDHGFAHVNKYPFLLYFLQQAGLAAYTITDNGEVVIDWEHTKAFPLPPGHAHIFVNLKGREPYGCVDPANYEDVQDAIIRALYNIIDPDTGRLVVSAAIRRQEARTFGVYDNQGVERVGDVLFAFHHGYCANPLIYPTRVSYPDGTFRYVPNAEGFEPSYLNRHFTGYHLSLPATHEMHGMIIMAGPSVPKGVQVAQPVDVIDIAPTWAYLMNVPIPIDAEGGVSRHLVKTTEASQDNPAVGTSLRSADAPA